MAGSRVGGSVLTGSGENMGNGTVFSDCSSARDGYDADVSIESVLAMEGEARGEPAVQVEGCGVGVGVESDCEARSSSSAIAVGPCSVEGLPFGLPEVLSEESSSPTLNFARPLLRAWGAARGGATVMERGIDASGAVEPVMSTETGREAGLTRRGRPRRGL